MGRSALRLLLDDFKATELSEDLQPQFNHFCSAARLACIVVLI
jgi:hypothetical protein